ncbi:obscurin-like [Ochotona curzoniae]|uniref:obscurin-like n=1 Tax=Ochotona curzoniae TaxID=130825 RepID=UPI001B34A9C2|nr:obscurin-like [Ochotona curzoniae]
MGDRILGLSLEGADPELTDGNLPPPQVDTLQDGAPPYEGTRASASSLWGTYLNQAPHLPLAQPLQESQPPPHGGPEQEAAKAQGRTVPIRIEGHAWPGASPGELLWNVHSHTVTETTHTTYIYQATGTEATRPPSMQVTIEDEQVLAGGTARFEAVIEGSPQPTVTWYKDDVQLADSARLSQCQEGTTYALVLRDVGLQDAGVYTCLACNAGGRVLCKAELLVERAGALDLEKQSCRRKLHSFYEVKEEIGRGVSGFVKRVQHKGNQLSCAAKFIPLRSHSRAQAYRERDILASLSHPLLTQLLDEFETRKTLILVLELCSSEELLDRLFRKGVVTEAEVKVYIQQLVEGLHYLHSHGVLHLDIKPPNILMVHPAREDIKICDFGLAQRVNPTEPQYSQYGAPEFVAPEVIEQNPVSEASDIWAMGVVSYLSLTCSSPFAGESDRATLRNVLEGRVSWSSPVAAHLSVDAKDFLQATLQRAPEARPSASQCLGHPWFLTSVPAEEAQFVSTKQLKFLLARSRWQRSLMSYKSVLVMRSIPELLHGPPDSPSLGVARHLRVQAGASSSSSSSSSDTELTPFARAKSLPPSPVTHSPLLHPRGFLRPSASLPEEAEACGPPVTTASPALPPRTGPVPRHSIVHSLFHQQAGEDPVPGGRRHPARRRHLLKGGYIARALPGLREPLMEQRALEEASEELLTPPAKIPSLEPALQSSGPKSHEDLAGATSPSQDTCFGGRCPPPAPPRRLLSSSGKRSWAQSEGVAQHSGQRQPVPLGLPEQGHRPPSAPSSPCSSPAAEPPVPPSIATASLVPGSKTGSEGMNLPQGMGQTGWRSGLSQEAEGSPDNSPHMQRPQEQATARKFSLGSRGGYAGVSGYGTFAFGGDAGGMLGQGPLWARLAWAASQSSEEQDEAAAGGESLSAAPELGCWEQPGQVSLVQIRDLSGDAEAADTLSLDISEVDPAYLNLSDLYDIKYLPFEFMIFSRVPRPERQPGPPSPEPEEEDVSEGVPGAAWPWPQAPSPEPDLAITEEPMDLDVLLGAATAGRKRKWPCLPLEEPLELGLRQRVKASMAHISRVLQGRTLGEPALPTCLAGVEKEGPPRKKPGFTSFRLSGLKGRDRAPSFLRQLSDETVVLGQSVTLACQVSAQPPAQATWTKDGDPLESSGRLLISSTLKDFHLLTILVVTVEDLGVYTCCVSNSLGTAATTATLRKAERPSSSPRPDVGEVSEDGVLLVWKPVESCGPVTYTVQCSLEGTDPLLARLAWGGRLPDPSLLPCGPGGSWTTLASDITDCCYVTSRLARGGSYAFRTACVSKAGMGPYSSPSEQVLLGGPRRLASEEDSAQGQPVQPLPSTKTFAFQMQIRRGRFSVVRQCREKASGRVLAAKIIPYEPGARTAVLREYEALKGLHHPHLAQLQAAYLSPRHLVLISELCSGPELLPCLAERTSYSESEVKDFLWQMLSATQYLHAHRILHLDLRSENMMVTEYNLLKVVDLGSAQSLDQGQVFPSETFKDYLETMAPELLEGQSAVPQTDIWAIGVTAFIMLSADYPVNGEGVRDLQRSLRKGPLRLGRCYAGLSGGAVAFLRGALNAQPWARPCAASCLQCPWLTEEGPAAAQPAPVTFPTTQLRAFLREREKRRALLCRRRRSPQGR